MALGSGKSKVNLFILNKDCETFGKGKVEVKTWRCMVNLDLVWSECGVTCGVNSGVS